jgi:hypothetical protein
MSKRTLAYIAIALAAVLSTGGAACAAYFSRPAAASVAAPASAQPLEDQVMQLAPRPGLNEGTTLYVPGQDWRQVLDLTLPSGTWVLHSDETIVNLGPSDWVRCEIAESPGAPLDRQSAFVGNPAQQPVAYPSQPATTATVLSETAALILGVRTTVSLYCDHDTSAQASSLPYVDPGAVLWAHQTGNLTSTTGSLP